MQIADFGDLGFQRHVIIGIFGSSPFSGFRIRFLMLGGWFSGFRIRFLMLGGWFSGFRIRFLMLGDWFSGFRGAFLDFPGFDYEFQTLGATEPPRFSEQYESSGFRVFRLL